MINLTAEQSIDVKKHFILFFFIKVYKHVFIFFISIFYFVNVFFLFLDLFFIF